MEAPWALTRPLITILTRLLSPQIKYLPPLLHHSHHSSSLSIFNASNQKINVLKNAISRAQEKVECDVVADFAEV